MQFGKVSKVTFDPSSVQNGKQTGNMQEEGCK
jgi:hypothetical protein